MSRSSSSLRQRRVFAAACAGMFVFGIVLALLGTLFGLPELRARLHLNFARQGDLLLDLFAGIFTATVIVGPLLDRFGSRVVLVFSSLLVSAALVGFASAHSFAPVAVASLTLGLGGGGLNTATNVLVSDLYGAERGAMLNVLGIFFGIGALSIPLLAASISALLTPGQLMVSAAALAGVCGLAYLAIECPPPAEAKGFSWREAARVVRYPGIVLFAALLFCQSGNEASIGGWVSTYAAFRGLGARTATWILAGYWAAMMLGRLISARLVSRISKGHLIFWSGVGSVAGSLVLLVASSRSKLAAGAALVGFSFAGIYPTVLAMVGDRYARYAGTVFGVLFSTALIGGMVFPWAIGHVSQTAGVRYGMFLPILSAILICVLVHRIRRSESRN
jgi:MFS transporter, FHS family, glucose/mannose:H+ symporter